MGNMIRENGNIITAADMVRVSVSKWDQYKLGEIKGHQYILGYDEESLPRDLWQWETVNSRDYLDSLIVLSFDIFNQPDKEKRLMLKWCKKYGLPFLGTGGEAYGCTNDDYKIFGPSVGCSTYWFHVALRQLQDAYFAAAALFDVNIGILREYKNYYETNIFDRESVEESLNLALTPSAITMQIDFNQTHPRLMWEFKTPIAVAYYHLALLAISPDGFIVKRCNCCNSLFIANKNNIKYCCNCDAKKKYKKTYKGKKEANNAKEENQ